MQSAMFLPSRDGFGKQLLCKQNPPNVTLTHCWVEEKAGVLFAKHAPMVFQIHFLEILILFSFIYKTMFPNTQF